MLDLPEAVEDIITHLEKNFWKEWSEKILDLPDTPDAEAYKIIIIHLALLAIVGNFLSSFEVEKRSFHLEDLIKNLRLMEVGMRDMTEDDL